MYDKIKNWIPAVLLSSLLFSGACSNNNEEPTEIIEAEIATITVQESAITGENISVEVAFYGRDGCSTPYNITANKVGQTITLRAFYSYPTDERNCTEILPLHRLTYTYFADMGGVYFFSSQQNASIADTLRVY